MLRFHRDTATLQFLAQAALFVMAADVVIASLTRFTDLPRGGWIFAVAMIVGILVALWLKGGEVAIDWRHVAVLGALLSLWGVVAGVLYDTSWDGTAYHLPSILELSRGWNPLDGDGRVGKANLHPHGLWLLQQTAGDLFGSFEVTKILHALLAAIALSSLLAWWEAEAGRTLDILPIALMYLIVLNPVVTAQALTFYVDGPLYLLSIIFLAQLFLAYRTDNRRHDFAALAAGLLLIGTKLTGLYYAGFIAILFCAFVIRRKSDLRRWTILFASVAVFGVLIVGFHPFVIQPWRSGTIKALESYDLTEKYGLTEGRQLEAARNLSEASGPRRLVYSVFSRTHIGGETQLKLPLLVSKSEILWMAVPDVRVAGFGPFFSGALLVAVVLFLFALSARHRSKSKTNLHTGFLLAAFIGTTSAFMFPEPWAARYVPLVWAIPLLLLASVDHIVRHSRAMTILFGAVLLLAAANTALAFAGNVVRTVAGNRDFYNLIWSLEAESTPLVIVPAHFVIDFDMTLKHRLENYGLSAEIREGYTCENILYVYHHSAKVCR